MDMEANPWKRHRTLAGELGIGSATVDAESYVSPEVYVLERERIFRRAWLLVGRESEVPAPGDFIKRTIYPLDAEALIVRGRDGVVRAFYNSCAHRGSALVREREGSTHLFVCPYHAWSYGTDGRCRAIPGAEFFPQVDKGEIGLAPIRADIWNGFVFLNFDESPEQTLGEFLGDFGERYAELPFAEFPHVMELTLDIDANWKCAVDAFLESYHVPVLHKRSLPDFPHPDNPHSVYYDSTVWPLHASHMIQGNPDWRPTGDVVKFIVAAAGNVSLRVVDSDARQPAAKKLSAYESVNPIGMPHFWLRMLSILPFAQIAISDDNYVTNQFWPRGPDRTQYVQRYYFRTPPGSFLEEFCRAHMIAATRDLLTEDAAMTRSQYHSLRSGGVKHLHLGENELLVRHVHAVVQAWMDDGPPRAESN
jgi:phenylpropionate dioxygenase-like ring-hydroxylating dioxygenase large terminal subunit